MKYRKLDADGDYSFGFGNANFYTDANAVAQAIGTKLKMFQGEWWEDVDDGLPLFQGILDVNGTSASIEAVDLIVQARIMETPYVNSMQAYTSSYENKAYTASGAASTTFGTVEVST